MTNASRGSRIGRRQWLTATGQGLGGLALASLLGPRVAEAAGPTLPVKAKRAIWLYMIGGPSQLDLFDYKPGLAGRANEDLPESVRGTQRISTMTSGQGRFPIAPSIFQFARYGQSGTWVSELLPWTAKLADDIAVIRSMNTEAVNHDPAILSMMTGSQIAGKPSVGSWLSYGLGSANDNLPTFVVMTSLFVKHQSDQAISSKYWGSAFLPQVHAGVPVRGAGDPVLYLSDPPGVDVTARRTMLDALGRLNQHHVGRLHDPDTQARIDQYEMAFRMQSAVPELVDLSGESAETRALYGDEVEKPGSFAANCLMARRMIERDVRFVQIFHRGWDSHYELPKYLPLQCQNVDRACYGLVTDLKQRGLLDDTLVIWCGEFGRTVFSQGELTATDYGRDHHPGCFSAWMAGGGVQPGITYGETDDYSHDVVRDPLPLRDFHATLLHLFGLDHNALAVPYQGLLQKLVGVDKPARVATGLLA